jgi:hypothetical protein
MIFLLFCNCLQKLYVLNESLSTDVITGECGSKEVLDV